MPAVFVKTYLKIAHVPPYRVHPPNAWHIAISINTRLQDQNPPSQIETIILRSPLEFRCGIKSASKRVVYFEWISLQKLCIENIFEIELNRDA